MTKNLEEKSNEEKNKCSNNICEECKENDESVGQNLILIGFKICKSCRISKTLYPLWLQIFFYQLELLLQLHLKY